MRRSGHIFVGGGIAALAGAVLLIRDHRVDGADITILEAGRDVGGSLDGARAGDGAYVVRGARMFERNYRCTLDLMATIPSPDLPGETLATDMDLFNRDNPVPFACVPVAGDGTGQRPEWRLPRRHVLAITRLLLPGEGRVHGKRISDVMDRDFFDTDMWLVMSTIFAFQPWHSAAEFRRYARRFFHTAQKGARKSGPLATRYNQAESLVGPIRAWLKERGVQMHSCARVTDAAFTTAPGGGRRITQLTVAGAPWPVGAEDRVYVTLGSMTDGARCGATGAAPPVAGDTPALDLWRCLAGKAPGFGRPDVFAAAESRTGWQAFTLTLPRGGLADRLAMLHPPGVGATVLYALRASPWRAALAPFAQPHFRDQPPGSEVIWGYGLRPDRPGRYCSVPMHEASGAQIIDELAGQLAMDAATRDRLFGDASVVSCRMPLITSQFMPRRPGDRPAIRPEASVNYACMGQFVELPVDTVFTVEYSVRSAWEAVCQLNPGGRRPPPVARPDRDPRVLLNVLYNRFRNMV